MTTVALSDLSAQKQYVKKLLNQGYDFEIVAGPAFVRGMRDAGYKSAAHALYELVDNSSQAGANAIHIAMDSPTKPTALAVIDDAHGMETDMLHASLAWGGTHRREADRGYGKYGFGLSSASLHIGKRVEVYSVVDGGDWQRTYLDADEIDAGKFNDGSRVRIPDPIAELPPLWVMNYIEEYFDAAITHGTVVVITKIDNLGYSNGGALIQNLQERLGVAFRNSNIPMFVQGKAVEACDPLFITPGMRYYDLDGDRAVPLAKKTIKVPVKDGSKEEGVITVRFARFPPTFFRTPEAKQQIKAGTKQMNARLHIADDNNGIIVCREGRQIDVIKGNRQKKFSLNSTTDRFWAVELDFPATLDHDFAITTNKQQVGMSDRMWDLLRAAGVFEAIGQMRAEYKREAFLFREEILKEQREAAERKRASEQAMRDAQKYKARDREETEEQAREREAAFNAAVAARVAETGREEATVRDELNAEAEENPYQVRTESIVDGPFFRVVQEGGARVLFLNTAHRFYTTLYRGEGSSQRTRSALEVLLWVLGEAELDATDQFRTFYRMARIQTWSPNLDVALEQLEGLAPDEEDEDQAVVDLAATG
jgi:hypothetical protein